MPEVCVELLNGSSVAVEYSPLDTAQSLVESVAKDLYGDAYNAYTELDQLELLEVCQQGLRRTLRHYERIATIVDTWMPTAHNVLRIQPRDERDMTTPQTRLMGLKVKFSVLNRDWVAGAIDVFDKTLYLRSTDFQREYQGAWKAVNLDVLDAYDLPKRPEILVVRSQLSRQDLQDPNGRFLALRLPSESRQLLARMIYTARSKALINTTPLIGPPPSHAVAPPQVKLPKKALLTPPASPPREPDPELHNAQGEPQGELEDAPPPVPPKDKTKRKRKQRAIWHTPMI